VIVRGKVAGAGGVVEHADDADVIIGAEYRNLAESVPELRQLSKPRQNLFPDR